MASEIIDLRQFSARALEPLLEAESRAWDTALRWDYSASRHLILSCLEEKRLSGYVLLSDGRLAGYSFFFYESDKGLIGNLFVGGDGTRLDAAKLLLEHVIETLLGTPGLNRVESQLPHFAFEELEPWFRAHGFDGYLRRFMVLSLTDGGLATSGSGRARTVGIPQLAPLPTSFRVEPWERKHDRAVAELLYHTYPNHVDTRINDQYGSLAGAIRLVDNIVHQRGCGEILPAGSWVAIHQATRKLVGVLAVTAVRPQTAHVPQIAVANEFQGAGLGTALLEASFRELARQGYKEVSLTVTDTNVGAVRLYARLGFETLRTFGAFVWDRR